MSESMLYDAYRPRPPQFGSNKEGYQDQKRYPKPDDDVLA
jgi:hypothetical protein